MRLAPIACAVCMHFRAFFARANIVRVNLPHPQTARKSVNRQWMDLVLPRWRPACCTSPRSEERLCDVSKTFDPVPNRRMPVRHEFHLRFSKTWVNTGEGHHSLAVVASTSTWTSVPPRAEAIRIHFRWLRFRSFVAPSSPKLTIAASRVGPTRTTPPPPALLKTHSSFARLPLRQWLAAEFAATLQSGIRLRRRRVEV